MYRGQPRRKNRPAAIASLVALLVLQALSSGLHFRVAKATAAPDGSFYQTIIICTGLGLRQITLDENGNPVDGKRPVSQTDCPACHLTAGCLATQAAASSAALPVLPAWTGVAPPSEALVPGRKPASANSRAPPLPA